MLDAIAEAKMKREHYEKYEALAREHERFDLPSYIPVTAERIKAALAAGDEHLNTIGLAVWDKAAAAWTAVPKQDRSFFATRKPCPTCHNGQVLEYPRERELWRVFRRSLSERVCLLKHVAKYWIGGAEPPMTKEG